MTSIRLWGLVPTAFTGLLLAFSAHAAPASGDQTSPGLRMRLPAPRLLAAATDQSATGQPATDQTSPTPYYPPHTPGTYPQPVPGGYPPAAGYAPYPYPPGYAPPYYYPQPAPTRATYLDYDPSKPIPPGYRLESGARKGLVIPGAIMFGISYGISIMVGVISQDTDTYHDSSNDRPGVPYNSNLLLIPVLGPWLALATLHDYKYCGESTYQSSTYSSTCWARASEDRNMWSLMLVFGGIVQGAGALMVTLGIAKPWQRLVLTENVQAQLVPVPMGHGGQGLALVGTFNAL